MDKNIQKTFIVGDKWIYYKIYCGVKTADTILLDVIKPFTDKLLEKNTIDKWFFIRYSDPEPHLRVRFLVKDLKDIGTILVKFHKIIAPFVKRKQIWNVQLASYQRELERYGANTIEESETVFFYDSEQILTIIQNSENDEERFLNLFNWLENLLSAFKFKDENVLSFLDSMQEQFKNEFKVDKRAKKELSTKYRKLEPLLLNANNTLLIDKNNLAAILERFLMLNKKQKLNISLNNLLASFIHMTINRCFRSKQRLYEMMLYDFLYRKNKSKFIRYGYN